MSKPAPEQPQTTYTVTELTRLIKKKLEEFGRLSVIGEILNLKYHATGHIYFTLKDADNNIPAVIWKPIAQKRPLELKDGIEVLVSGDLTVFQGRYQLVVHTVEPRGLGALLLALELRKKKLAAEGLFDPLRKKNLPQIPRKICVVTSPSGAAVQDIIKTIEHRFSKVAILVYPVRVQGEGASAEIAAAIRTVNSEPHFADVEVIIVGRGGGSLEDLWAFNEEDVAYAIAASHIPTISAVGHEIDFTIADFVADRRARTPTEAGEIVLPELNHVLSDLEKKRRALELVLGNRLRLARSRLDRMASHRAFSRPQATIQRTRQGLDVFGKQLQTDILRSAQKQRNSLNQLHARLQLLAPALAIQNARQRLDRLAQCLYQTLFNLIQQQRQRIKNCNTQLDSLSPLAVLQRGYSITFSEDGNTVIRNQNQLQPGDIIWTRLDGSVIKSRVENTSGTI